MTFDPNEKRDEYGRWTAGGEADTITAIGAKNAESVARYAKAATRVAVELGFDPTKIAVVSEERPKFMLNGTLHDWAGAADLQKGTIELYEPHLDPASIPDVVAHEIGHQKFERFRKDYIAEKAKMNEEGVFFKPTEVFAKDGTLTSEYAKQYPVYDEYSRLFGPGKLEEYRASDGITPYSKQWWDEYGRGDAKVMQAMHETLAEMTARAYTLPVSFDSEAPKFREAGFALDEVHGSFHKPSEYKVRKWKGDAVDESVLPPTLREQLDKLRARANYEARFLSGKPSASTKYSDPAPEWVALYNAVQKHWSKT